MNGIVVVDKPEGFTSHDVIARLRRIYSTRRIGHAGTLDPLATGVLLCFVGRATRAVEFAESDSKQYIAGIRLGLKTDTQDITGKVLKCVQPNVTISELSAAAEKFTGDITQIPPMYSAIKVGGKKLYELARRGIVTEREPRHITIHELRVISTEEIYVHCSKGTYIRTLCEDIGEELGCSACMSSLRRVKSGGFEIKDALTLEQIEADPTGALLPLESIFKEYERIIINAASEKKCRNGANFSVNIKDGTYRVFSVDGEFLMLGRAENCKMNTIKSFFEVK